MSLSDPRLLDLRSHPRPELLAAFVDLYLRTFTDPSEREDPAQWPPRLYADLPAPQPRMHLLVAVADNSAAVELHGGIAFEYYRDSRCGLLTYLVTAATRRRRGLARRLVARAIELLHEDAREHGAELRAVFAETEDPSQVAAHGNSMPPSARVSVLARLGAYRVDIPYVQPRLEGGSGPCRHLLLLAFHPDGTQADHIEGEVLQAFLHEFYRALGVTQPQRNEDFRSMERRLAAPVALVALR